MMNNRQRYSLILAVLVTRMSFGVMASLNYPVTIERKDSTTANTVDTSTTSSSSSSASSSSYNNDNQCTQEMIEHMLRNGMTIQEGKMDGKIAPGHCFYTRCPDSTWLETYYRDFVNTNSNTMKKFVGISVGCNKGLDAVNTLRMGSNSERFSKEAWLHEMFDDDDDSSKTGAYGAGVCHQGHTPSFPLNIHQTNNERSAVMHCIEPIPSTVAKLQRSVEHLGWNNIHSDLSNTADQTFVLAQYAISNVHDQMFLPKDVKMGKESTSLSHCASSYLRQKNKCEDVVDVTTLDSYVSKYISSTTVDEDNKEKEEETIINVLSIDVEGYDYNVLLGGFATLKQTEYLEFEVHRKGPWRSQSLKEAIDLLDVIGFTCYWAGSEGRLWRLTGPNCFLDHYEYKCWSNVACANRLKVPTLVDIMDQTFQATLTDTTLPSKELSSSLASKHE